MNSKLNVSLVLLTLFGLVGCATTRKPYYPDVRPGADGVHKVITQSSEKESVERLALYQAESYCETLGGKRVGIISEDTKYTGDMDESTRKALKKASKAAMVLGGGVGIAGGSRSAQQTGTAVGAAGAVGTIMTGDDAYVSTMTFKCQ